ncbi:hypothetical protein OXYTRIMIC_384 [Oxytricha trifallax]|uniref:Uncharacterized protein n=1 Tax=Oxytricha trifallax TaxID=1172189 RepID=A0A073I0E8_9SPIT|nr:hypothetical protein OXYTRIMIC_384 [Oxytricha trifallax]
MSSRRDRSSSKYPGYQNQFQVHNKHSYSGNNDAYSNNRKITFKQYEEKQYSSTTSTSNNQSQIQHQIVPQKRLHQQQQHESYSNSNNLQNQEEGEIQTNKRQRNESSYNQDYQQHHISSSRPIVYPQYNTSCHQYDKMKKLKEPLKFSLIRLMAEYQMFKDDDQKLLNVNSIDDKLLMPECENQNDINKYLIQRHFNGSSSGGNNGCNELDLSDVKLNKVDEKMINNGNMQVEEETHWKKDLDKLKYILKRKFQSSSFGGQEVINRLSQIKI